MRARLGKLRWQLMLSYTLVTVLASLGWLLGVLALSTYITYGSPLLHTRLAGYAAQKIETISIRAALGTTPPDETVLTRWIEDRQRDAPWPVLYVLGMQLYGFDLRLPRSSLIVFDAHGRIVASTQPNQTVGSPAVQHWVDQALAGNMNVTETSGREPMRGMYAAVPIFGEDRSVRGALLVQDEDAQWRRPFLSSFGQMVTGLLPLFVLMFPVAIISGALAAVFVSRPLTNRIDAMRDASVRWSEGGFDARVRDSRQDELGQLSHRLNDMAAQLEQLMIARQENASLQERQRIARELHDSTKQQAFAVAAQLAASRALLLRDPKAAEMHLLEAERLNDALRAELVQLILELRPPRLEARSIAVALGEYVYEWSRYTGIEAQQDIDDITVADEMEQAVFRIAQESLSNIVRHSGASRVVVTLKSSPAETTATVPFVLMIEDNGHGFDPNASIAKGGFGLASMKQRAEAAGARLDVHSTPGQGTRVMLET